MTPAEGSATHSRLPDALGLTELEERAYRMLLRRPGATQSQVAVALHLSVRQVTRVLSALQLKGLVTQLPERVRRYLPAPPSVGVEALILRRQEELQRARLMIPNLQSESPRPGGKHGRERIVEIITGHAATSLSYRHLQRSAQRDMFCLVRKPLIVSSPDKKDDAREQARASGVRYRSVCHTDLLQIPEWIDEIRRALVAGEEVRLLPDLPLKLIIADRRAAIMPLDLQKPSGPSLLIRPSALLDALCVLGEVMWERAAPVSLGRSAALKIHEPRSRIPADTQRLVSLLGAGLNDKAIAHKLGISPRTLKRRLTQLHEALGARTRFQAGWAAALRLKDALSQ